MTVKQSIVRTLIIWTLGAILLGVLAAKAGAAKPRALHVGQAAPIVCGVKWEISGAHSHKPNRYTVAGTYKLPLRPNCNYFGKPFGKALVAYKYRLGYPTKYLKPVLGTTFLDLLSGHRHRPLLWVALAQRRAKAVKAGPTKLALQIVAFEARQVGTRESCCNRGSVKGPGGYSVDDIERAGGLLGEQWCGLFQSFGFGHFGIVFAPPPYNRFFVPSIGQWAQNHGYALVKGKRKYQATLTATARVGSLVAFLSGPNVLDGRHVGIVASISAKGYYTIEGNSRDAVTRHWYPWGSALRVFINVPGVA